MKHIACIRKGTIYVTLSAFTLFSCSAGMARGTGMKNIGNGTEQTAVANGAGTFVTKKKIRIALLLDTSNSMDGLINQAKSQLWKIVNELAKAKTGEDKPELLIALYEYGNSRLPANEGYIRQVLAFTDDLDKVSEQLFALTTNGGEEYCGQVIRDATTQLQWMNDGSDLQQIFIAGNEPFTQGSVNYIKSCFAAKEKGIFVNTIFCNSCDEGVKTMWKDGADLTNGNYMCIEQDRKTLYVETPYDKEIVSMNEKMNATYLMYGTDGESGFKNMKVQDGNAASYGVSNMSTRVTSKNTAVYSNYRWDLVDASKRKDFSVHKLKENDLPTEMRGKSQAEKEKMIEAKKAEREAISKKVTELSKKRDEYVAAKLKELGEQNGKSLDAAMIKAIREQAVKRGFSFDAN